MKPTIYLSNWSSHRTPGCHGPGRKLTIMALPRSWERGGGTVGALVPSASDLRAVQRGAISGGEYQRRYEVGLSTSLCRGIEPGSLRVDGQDTVRDGDTLCCSCSRDVAAAGRCHRVWAAAALVRAGWRVILDGEEVPGVG